MALNIVFMGTPNFAVPILKSIVESKHNIIEVYTQPPKKRDRGQKINLSPIHKYCLEKKIKVRHPEILDTSLEYDYFVKLKADLVIVVAYGKIIPKNYLSIKDLKFINIHASLLPKWRGAAPIHRAIMNLDTETGISIMQITPKLDAGPIMMSSRINITKTIDFETLSNELSILGSKLILESLNKIEKGDDKFIPQIESDATYAEKITKSESRIDWKDSASKVIAKINALKPYPGSWFEYKKSRIKVIKAIEIDKAGLPGEIIEENFTVACSSNAIKILELQKEGKNKMKTFEFLKGNSLTVGDQIK
tara:strand:- start:4236 stop:5156 length:921 start_codon:yes stop_codon:yes gene_type:complete